MKTVAIVQSNYIPWKGYFDLIAAVDEFILFDDMQYTRRDWRNRNMIKTPQGRTWLTVPVRVKGKFHQTIRETGIDGDSWRAKHWEALRSNYARAEHFEEISRILEPFYMERKDSHLTTLNHDLIRTICDYLGITTKITDCREYSLKEGKTERLADLCAQADATDYISGPAARDYVDPAVFEKYGVRLHWFEYSGYPEYPQLWGDFIHEVTILDLMFNCGSESTRYMKYAGRP